MMVKEKHPIIGAILKEKKITDFLESRGINPVRESGNRLSYLCPIHEGDTAPSFIVFTDGEYQTYKCFGCHSGRDIINLLCDLDHIPIKQAISILLHGIDVIQEDITSSLIAEAVNIWTGNVDHSNELEMSMLKSGSFCRMHLNKNNDDEEINFFLNMYQIMDNIIRIGDVGDLEKIYNILCRKGIPERIRLYKERQEGRILNRAMAVKKWKK